MEGGKYRETSETWLKSSIRRISKMRLTGWKIKLRPAIRLDIRLIYNSRAYVYTQLVRTHTRA